MEIKLLSWNKLLEVLIFRYPKIKKGKEDKIRIIEIGIHILIYSPKKQAIIRNKVLIKERIIIEYIGTFIFEIPKETAAKKVSIDKDNNRKKKDR